MCGDGLRERFGPVAVFRGAALMAGAGLDAALLTGDVTGALAGLRVALAIPAVLVTVTAFGARALLPARVAGRSS